MTYLPLTFVVFRSFVVTRMHKIKFLPAGAFFAVQLICSTGTRGPLDFLLFLSLMWWLVVSVVAFVYVRSQRTGLSLPLTGVLLELSGNCSGPVL
jgi:hypothetical protein